jgi:uncharacterized membrane protein YhhN
MTMPLLALAVCCLVALLIAERRGSVTGKLIFKPLLSALFIYAALLQPKPVPAYATALLIGLCLSWFGDLLLIFKSKSLFLAGLCAFLLGHLCYAAAFYGIGTLGLGTAAGLIVLLLPAVIVFRWLQPHLGKMRGPVIGYILVISVMVGGALSVFAGADLPTGFRWSVLSGAIVFYLSDIFVARDTFIRSEYSNRLIGLPLYYLGQFLFAFSIGMAGI